jgi:hypothetical protein
MRLVDFEAMVVRMAGEVPREFLAGVAEIAVSPRTVPHPERPGIYTLGECIPLPTADGAANDGIQSRVVLYHGSFAALARVTPGFDWREEAFETLTHELRHHLEWRARAPDLEELDWAVEQNYARQFLDRIVRDVPATIPVHWAGRDYQVTPPTDASLPAFLVLDGLADAPAGEVVVVLRRKPGVLALFRPVTTYHAVVQAE